MGKLGGRSRQWLLEGLSNEYKPIPEYGLRVILAFSPRTSFLVPLDRCIQFAATAIKQGMFKGATRVCCPSALPTCRVRLSTCRTPPVMQRGQTTSNATPSTSSTSAWPRL